MVFGDRLPSLLSAARPVSGRLKMLMTSNKRK